MLLSHPRRLRRSNIFAAVVLSLVLAGSASAQLGSGSIFPGFASVADKVGGAANLLTTGAIPFVSGPGNLTENVDFCFDSANKRLGVGTCAPTESLHIIGNVLITGGHTTNLVNVSAVHAVAADDSTINCTANSFAVTLPTAVGVTGRIYTIKNSGAGTITVNTTSSQTIDGALTVQRKPDCLLRAKQHPDNHHPGRPHSYRHWDNERLGDLERTVLTLQWSWRDHGDEDRKTNISRHLQPANAALEVSHGFDVSL